MIGCQGQWRAGPMNHDIFQCDAIKTQYSSIPSFHHSNCERSELSSIKPIPILIEHRLAEFDIQKLLGYFYYTQQIYQDVQIIM